MSDQILILVFNTSETEQNATAENILQYFFDKGIIKNEKAENVLSGDGLGFIPGDNIHEFSEEDPEDYGMNLTTNGLTIIKERRAFHSYADEISYKCPTCMAETNVLDSEHIKSIWAKVDEYDKEGTAILTCRNCKAENAIDTYSYMEQMAFGNIAVECYNWPPISDSCIADLEKIANSKLKIVWSHL